MNFFSNRRWFNPSQPKYLQWATWLVYFAAFWNFVALVDGARFTSDARIGVIIVLLMASIPLAVLGGSDMAMGRRRGYYMCLAVAFLPAVMRYLATVGNYGALEVMRWTLFPFVNGLRSVINWLFEVGLVVCVLHPVSRAYVKVWITD